MQGQGRNIDKYAVLSFKEELQYSTMLRAVTLSEEEYENPFKIQDVRHSNHIDDILRSLRVVSKQNFEGVDAAMTYLILSKE